MAAMGRFETDFLAAKSHAEEMSEMLLKKYRWMRRFRFLGDVAFRPNRTKESVDLAQRRGEEISFGLNMELLYLDLKGQERKTEIIFRFKPKPFYDIYFKPYKKNPTTENLIEQFKNTWVICGSGNIPEAPKAFAVFKVSKLPTGCFAPVHEHGKIIKYKIAFQKYSRWNSTGQIINLFGGNIIDDLFNQIRI